MWRLDTTPYGVVVQSEGKPKLVDYDVKGSFAAILFNGDLKLTAQQGFEAKDLVDRIARSDASVLVDRQDLARLKVAYEAVRSPRIEDLELLRRIRDIPAVEVTETSSQNGEAHDGPAEARVLASTVTIS